MKLSDFTQSLDRINEINFIQLNSSFIPQHFHITEAGLITKNYIDCGGTIRTEKSINFQVWVAEDTDHRLSPDKLKKIVSSASVLFNGEDLDVEIEYQTETISRFGLEFNGKDFVLTAKHTNCLAKDQCGVPQEKQKIRLSALSSVNNLSCTPGGGCC